jgi:hypothetical protein
MTTPREAAKVCTRCFERKLLADYHKCCKAKDGRKSWCKTCALAAAEKRRRENPGKCKAAVDAAKAKNPEKYKALSEKWRRENPDKRRAAGLECLRRDAQRAGETYLKRLLVAQGFGAFANIPAEIVDLKRQQIVTRRLARQLKKAHELGVADAAGRVDFAAVMQRVHRVIRDIEPHDSVERYTGLGVEVLQGHARITSPWVVEVTLADGSTQTLTTKNIVIAAGLKGSSSLVAVARNDFL